MKSLRRRSNQTMSESAEAELEMRNRKSGSSLQTMEVDDMLSDMQQQADTSRGFLTPVVWSILACEAAERFAYFGFRAILVLYFKNALQLPETTAIALFAYVASLAYFSPIIGALLADGSWGRYRTIIRFASLYLVGLAILTTGAFLHSNKQADTDSAGTELSESELFQKRATTFVGLFFVCIGTGGIKPCVSAFGADQVAAQAATNGHDSEHNGSHDDTTEHEADEEPSSSLEVQAFFAYFYFCINLGALTSIFLVPILKARYGFGFAFLAPTIFLFFALAAFLSKRKEYVHHVPGQRGSLGSMFWLCGLLLYQRIQQWWSSSQSEYQSIQHSPSSPRRVEQSNEWTTQQLQDANRTLQILPVLSMLPIFWMLYDQQGSVWTLQASRMKLTFGIEPEQMNVINPVEILLFIPLFDKCIYPSIERLVGHPFPHLSRMAWGMLFCALAFFVSGVLESIIQDQEANDNDSVNSISILWQLPQITLLAIAEILLSVTGYDFCYSNSSTSCKALIMALFLMTTAGGDFFAGILYNGLFRDMNRVTVMHVCGGLMLLNLLLFLRVAKWWNRCQAQLQARTVTPSCEGEVMGVMKTEIELT
mmetsp:Transcript_34953/g.84569  ORF Transcript_34953/g.84569 Transcript_34953/m.84569 type:complete len:595 (+) Transcript_34953:151-1935(+)